MFSNFDIQHGIQVMQELHDGKRWQFVNHVVKRGNVAEQNSDGLEELGRYFFAIG